MKTSIVSIQRPFDIVADKQKNIQKWDIDNGYPQRYIWLAQRSVTALSCLDLFSKFLWGEGWLDVAFGEEEINADQTMDDLGEEIMAEWALHRGYAIVVGINGMLQHSSYQVMPFQRVRKGDGAKVGQYGTHEHWGITGKKFKTQDIDWFFPYTEDRKKLLSYIKDSNGFEHFKGMLYYVSIDKLSYPTPKFLAALNSVETEGEAGEFARRNVTTGFMASHIFKFSEEFESDKERDEMINYIRTFQGAQEGSKIMIVEGQDEDDGQKLTIEKVEVQDVDRLFEFTEESAADKIRRSFLIPKALIGQEEATGFDTERINDSRAYYNSIVIWDRTKAIKAFKKIVGNFERPLKTNDNWDVKPLYSDEIKKEEDEPDNSQ